MLCKVRKENLTLLKTFKFSNISVKLYFRYCVYLEIFNPYHSLKGYYRLKLFINRTGIPFV